MHFLNAGCKNNQTSLLINDIDRSKTRTNTFFDQFLFIKSNFSFTCF